MGGISKEEENGVLHRYMQIDGDVWNYEKYDADDNSVDDQRFTQFSNSFYMRQK